ncbi:dihydrofolate reductase, partial [Clostridioides difficile]
KVSQEVTIIDIASSPGGVDYSVVKEAGINATLCLGLPGKYSPKTSGEILVNAKKIL